MYNGLQPPPPAGEKLKKFRAQFATSKFKVLNVSTLERLKHGIAD
jgi:hypothetical protein